MVLLDTVTVFIEMFNDERRSPEISVIEADIVYHGGFFSTRLLP
jgi:hypothetical protein